MAIDQDPTTPLTDEDRFHDIVGGRRIVKTLGVRDLFLASELLIRLGTFDLPKRSGRFFLGLIYDLGLGDGTRRMPEISFVSHEKWPARKRLPSEDPWRMVPDLVAEIVTPGMSGGQVRRRVVEYRRAGVRLIWQIFPEGDGGRVAVFRPDSISIEHSRDGRLDGGDVLPGFRIAVARLFDYRSDVD